MARKRIEGTALKSYEDADQALRKIGELDRKVEAIVNAANARIDAAKAAAKEQCEPLLAVKVLMERQLKEFAHAHKSDFEKVRTRDLVFGSIGFRKSKRLSIPNVADTLAALKALALTRFVRTTEEPDKELIKTEMTAEQLVAVGASITETDAFGYEVKAEAIEQLEEVAS